MVDSINRAAVPVPVKLPVADGIAAPAEGAQVVIDAKPVVEGDVAKVEGQHDGPQKVAIDDLPVLVDPRLQKEIDLAKTERKQADAAVDKLVQAFGGQLDELQKLAKGLKFGQGGDVEKLGRDRETRFNAHMARVEKLLKERPVPALEIAESLRYMRTMLAPPAKPVGPDGKSRAEQFWGKPVPGAEKLLKGLDDLIKQAGKRGSDDPATLWGANEKAIAAQQKLSTLNTIKQDGVLDGIQKKMDALEVKEGHLDKATAASKAATAKYKDLRDDLFKDFDAAFMGKDKSLLAALEADKSPMGAQALANFKAAENALKLGRYGAAKQFMQRLQKDLADMPDSPALKPFADGKLLEKFSGRTEKVREAWVVHHEAYHKMTRLEQDVAGMRKGLEGAIRALPIMQAAFEQSARAAA